MEYTHELSLVIPFYNEEENIEKVVNQMINKLKEEKIDYELIIVDNGSWDNTTKLSKAMGEKHEQVKVVRVEKNEGYGWGIINGLKICKGKYLGWMGGDDQNSPEDVVLVFKKLKQENINLCKVSRIIRHDGIIRKIMSAGYNKLFCLFFPISSKDINGSPKIMRQKCYKELNLLSKDWFIDAEVMIKSGKLGYKIEEVPVEFKKRSGGSSNVGLLNTSFEFIKNLIKYKIGGLNGKK